MSQCRSFGSNYHPSSQSRKVSIGIVVDQFAKTKPNGVREDAAVVPITGNFGSSKVNTNEDTHKNGKVKDVGKEKESEPVVHETSTSSWVGTRSILHNVSSGVFDAKQGQRYNGSNNSQQHPGQYNSSQKLVLQSRDGQQKKFDSVTYGRMGQIDGNTNRVDEVPFATAQELKVPVEEVAQEKAVNTEKVGTEALRMKIWGVLEAVSTPTKELSNSQNVKTGTDNLEPARESDEKKSSTVRPRQNSDTIESDSDSPSHTMKRPVTRSLTRKRPIKVQQHKAKNTPPASNRHKQPEKSTFSFEEGWARRTTSATIGGSSGSKSRKKNISRIEPRKLQYSKRSSAAETFHATDSGKTKDHTESSSGFEKGTGRFCGFSSKENRHSYQSPSIKKNDKLGGNYESIFPKNVDEQVDVVDPSLKNSAEPQFEFNSPTLREKSPTDTCFGGSSPKSKQGEQEDVYSPMKGIISMENIRSFKSFFALNPDSDKKNKAKEISVDEVEHEDSPAEPQFNFNTHTLALQLSTETCFGGSSLKTSQGKQEDVDSPMKGVHSMKNIRSFVRFFALNPDGNKKKKEKELSDDEVEHEDSPVKPQFDFNNPTLGMNTPAETCFDGSSPINDQGKQEIVCSPVKRVLQRENIQRFRNFFASKRENDNKNKEREISDDEVKHEESDGDGSESCDEGASEAETPEIVTAQQPEILFRPTKRCRINEGADATVYSPSSSPEVSGKFYGLPFEMNEENGLARAVSLFAMVLERVKRRMKSVDNKRSAEILTSVATEMHVQLQNAESHIQTDVRKLSGIGKTKKRRLETKFQEQQEQLKGIYERFRNEVNMHLQDCRSTFEGLESEQTEFRDIVEKQKASHGTLMLQAEQAVKTQLNDAERRITTVHKALKAMGRPRQGKNKINEDKEKLIKTVRDDNQEFLEFSVSIPSREEMINENFPITEFNVKCSEVDLLRQNLVDVYDSKMDAGIDGKELIHAWNNLYHEGLLKHQFFLMYSPGNQVRFMELMLKDIDESKRSLRYKKWKFALRERQRRRLLESTSEEIDTSSGEERTSEEVSEEIDTSFGEERTSEEVKDVMHKTRVIEFNGRSTSIILQEDNGPCPLLAICNVLLLRNELELSEDTTEISQKFLLSFVHELIKSKNNNKDAENIDDVIPRLATGIDVDITFNGITEFESTRERGVFDLLDIPLYHGWVVDPQDTDTCNAIGSKSYNTLMVELAGHERGTELIEDKKRSEVRIGKNQKTKTPEKDSVDDSVGSVSDHKKAGKGDLEEDANVLTAIISSEAEARKLSESKIEYTPQGQLINDFLTNSSQLTIYGLTCLQDQVEESKLCIFFRNYHFSTMYKFGGQLYLLVTDVGFRDWPNHIWEILDDVKGTTKFVRTFMKPGVEDDHGVASGMNKHSRASTSMVEDQKKFAKRSQTKGEINFSLNFPDFWDRDYVKDRNEPFTLHEWLKSHECVDSRWLPSVLNESNLDVEWYGDRLKRECLAVMQSIMVAVMDYHHQTDRPHRNLGDYGNIKFFQCLHSLGGHLQVRYRIELPEPLIVDESEALKGFSLDMDDVKRIFIKILAGKPLNSEIYYLFDLMSRYPFNVNWMNQLLRNFTVFWDSKSRADFVVLLYYWTVSNMRKFDRNRLYKSIKYQFGKNYTWLHRIPKGTFFYKVLTFNPNNPVKEPAQNIQSGKKPAQNVQSGQSEEPPQNVESGTEEPQPQPQYEDENVEQICKFYRAVLQHNRDTSGGGSRMDTHTVESNAAKAAKDAAKTKDQGTSSTRRRNAANTGTASQPSVLPASQSQQQN